MYTYPFLTPLQQLGNDVDPLGDAPAPRHAIESDEEEDEYNPLGERHVTPNLGTSVRVEYSEGAFKAGQPLAVMTGLTSVLLPLSEEDKRGEIVVNGVTVRLNPSCCLMNKPHTNE